MGEKELNCKVASPIPRSRNVRKSEKLQKKIKKSFFFWLNIQKVRDSFG